MSWDQEYSIPSVQDLLEQLAKKTAVQLLEQHLKDTQGLSIVSMEEVEIADGFIQDVIAQKVTLSDGRVFVPKLVQTFTENGNHGVDIFQYVLEGETPTVEVINEAEQICDCDHCATDEEDYVGTALVETDEEPGNESGC